jgi:predicted nucleic acid-binding protein
MIIVDSSVWIDYFNGKPTPQIDRLLFADRDFQPFVQHLGLKSA